MSIVEAWPCFGTACSLNSFGCDAGSAMADELRADPGFIHPKTSFRDGSEI
jgi:hypothetical protein